MFTVPEQYRVTTGHYASNSTYGNNGLFILGNLRMIASDGDGWEHVSVSFHDRTPNWDEMCDVKDFFWGNEDTVIQYHPASSEYVNYHPYCLHLWRPIGQTIVTPPSYMVGPKK
jgi:hypothetical protein